MIEMIEPRSPTGNNSVDMIFMSHVAEMVRWPLDVECGWTLLDYNISKSMHEFAVQL